MIELYEIKPVFRAALSGGSIKRNLLYCAFTTAFKCVFLWEAEITLEIILKIIIQNLGKIISYASADLCL